MRMIFFGKGLRARHCLARLLDEGFQVAAVVAERRHEPAGEVPRLRELAERAGADWHIVRKRLRSPATRALLADYGAELFVLAGYTGILPEELLAVPPLGTINLHGGRLPEYRGCAPIPWQIIRGESTLGLTVLYADAGIDSGAILAEETYSLRPEEGATEAVRISLERFPAMLVGVLRALEAGRLRPRPQNLGSGRWFTRRHPQDGVLDCRFLAAREVCDMIRALRDPYPGAFAFRGGEKIVLQRAGLIPETICGVPGHVPLRRPDGMVLIARDRGLLLTEVRGAGGIVPASHVLRVGDRLLAERVLPSMS